MKIRLQNGTPGTALHKAGRVVVVADGRELSPAEAGPLAITADRLATVVTVDAIRGAGYTVDGLRTLDPLPRPVGRPPGIPRARKARPTRLEPMPEGADRLKIMRQMQSDGASLRDIGAAFGVSPEHVRQILAIGG